MNVMINAVGALVELFVTKPLEQISGFLFWRDPEKALDDHTYKRNIDKLIARNKAASESRE